jgi:hypothetical protein
MHSGILHERIYNIYVHLISLLPFTHKLNVLQFASPEFIKLFKSFQGAHLSAKNFLLSYILRLCKPATLRYYAGCILP